jgi:hypothetical protein
MFKSEFPPLFCDPLGEVIPAFEPSVRGPDEECHDVVQVRVVELHWLLQGIISILGLRGWRGLRGTYDKVNPWREVVL